MLQLWRTGPSRQRVSAAPAAQKVPFLSECFPHGGQLPGPSAAASAASSSSFISGNLTEGRGRGAEPGHPLRKLRVNDGGRAVRFFHWNTDHRKSYTSGFYLLSHFLTWLSVLHTILFSNLTGLQVFDVWVWVSGIWHTYIQHEWWLK